MNVMDRCWPAWRFMKILADLVVQPIKVVLEQLKFALDINCFAPVAVLCRIIKESTACQPR